MENKISSLELMAIVNELRILLGSRLKKIYDLNKEGFFFEFNNVKLGTLYLKAVLGKLLFLSLQKPEMKKIPSTFCMLLRKYLSNSFLNKIHQVNSERIVELEFSSKDKIYYLIIELFSDGNFILCDSSRTIIAPLFVKKYSHRIIKKGEKYKLPPLSTNFLILNYNDFEDKIKKSIRESIVKTLALDFSIGGKYSEEICLRANIDKNKQPSSLSQVEIKNIYSVFVNLLKELKYGKLHPSLVLKGNKIIGFEPFPLLIYKEYNKVSKEYFSYVLEEYYSELSSTSEEEKFKQKYVEKLNLLNARKQEQEQRILNLNKEISNLQEKANLIYEKYDIIENLLNSILNARERGFTWEEIKNKINEAKEIGDERVKYLREIDIIEKRILFNFNGEEVWIDLNKSLTENANLFYEQVKKLKDKLNGAEEALNETIKEIENLNVKNNYIESKVKQVQEKQKWYEKFRWFISSDGYLVVSGRNAMQNELLISKYLELNDLVFHADFFGSPFTIVKSKGGEIPPKTIEEAAEQTACFSRAWKEGVSVDVYYVKPTQVSKSPPSGEYISFGSFMIRGKRNYIKNIKMEVAIGIREDGKIISGPISSVIKYAKKYFIIVPGEKQPTDIARKLQQLFGGGNIDEIVRMLPPGNCEIKVL